MVRRTNTHKYTPEDDSADERKARTSSSQGLGHGSEDDEDEFESIHLFTTNDISENTEADLTNDGTGMNE